MRRGFAEDDSGATAVEYALLGGLVMVVIVTAVKLTGTNVLAQWQRIAAAVAAAAG